MSLVPDAPTRMDMPDHRDRDGICLRKRRNAHGVESVAYRGFHVGGLLRLRGRCAPGNYQLFGPDEKIDVRSVRKVSGQDASSRVTW